MRTKLQTVSLLALAVLSAAAFAAQQTLSVKRQAKEGQTFKYKLEGDIDFNGTPVGLTATVTEKVTKVDTDGSYTLEQNQQDAKITMNGADQEIPSNGPATTVYKPSGEITSIKGESPDMSKAYRMANLGLLYDAGKALKVGDKWSYDVKADEKLGTVAAKAEYELVSEEKVGKYDTIKVKATVKETDGPEPAEATGFVWLDKADGSMVKSEAEWKNAPLPGAPGPLNAKIKLTRVD